MSWFMKHLRHIGIAIVTLLFLFTCLTLIPLSAASAHEGASRVATPTIVSAQATLPEDATMTALSKEQLEQEVTQLKNQNFWSPWTNFATPFSIFVALVAASFGFWRWRVDRRDAHTKDLKAQAEERFKTAVTALGGEKEGIQVGGAILLRSFLHPDDKKDYEQYYPQIFDLVVAYLRPLNTSLLSENPDPIPPLPENPHTPLPLTPLRQALIVVFKEVFPCARQQALSRLDATSIQLDRAYLAGADLKRVSLPYSSLRKADLSFAQLEEANLRGSQLEDADFVAAQLKGANLTVAWLERANFNDAQLEGVYLRGSKLKGAYFRKAQLKEARLEGANLTRAHLSEADLSSAELIEANLSEADLTGAVLTNANLTGANLRGANLRDADLKDTKLNDVKGLTKEQLTACKAKGAIVDEDITTSVSQSIVAPSSIPQSNDAQASSAPPAQKSIPPPDPDGSNVTFSQQGPES